MNNTYTIKGIKNEKYIVTKVDRLKGLEHYKKALSNSDKYQGLYSLERVIKGTRKKPHFQLCLRFKKSKNFITYI